VTRCHADLALAPVRAFNIQALKASRQRFENPYEGFLQVGEAFGRSVVKALDSRRSFLDSNTIFFSYDTGFLEPAQWIKERGGKAIVCQMDPARYEVDLVKAEEKRWPGWAKRTIDVPESYFRRRGDEWAVADLIMVNSEWSKQALIKQGVSDKKIVVIPLAYEVSEVKSKTWKVKREKNTPFTQGRPLRVLFLGQVILRKGIQYLIESARLLEKESIHFDIVGPNGITDEALMSAPANMTFHGAVNRDRTEQFYRDADLFVLPTLSDGFALTQLEAMAQGLPVIATANCGEVVNDDVDGLVVPASDANALAEAFQLILQDPEKLHSMSDASRVTVKQFSLTQLEKNLECLEKQLCS
jgi:glycosyltransferase involved in cell wall biosynthesis